MNFIGVCKPCGSVFNETKRDGVKRFHRKGSIGGGGKTQKYDIT